MLLTPWVSWYKEPDWIIIETCLLLGYLMIKIKVTVTLYPDH